MRILKRPGQTLHLFEHGGEQVPEAHLRSTAGPHRHPRGGATRGIREAVGEPAGGVVGYGAGEGGSGALAAAGTIYQYRITNDEYPFIEFRFLQRGYAPGGAAQVLRAG